MATFSAHTASPPPPAEQASAIVYLVLSMVAGFLLVESGLWLGSRLMQSLAQ